MSKRFHVIRTIYGNQGLDRNTLQSLAQVEQDLYIIVRESEGPAGAASLAGYPQYFELAFSNGSIAVFRVDAAACHDGSNDPSLPFIMEEEILGESGIW